MSFSLGSRPDRPNVVVFYTDDMPKDMTDLMRRVGVLGVHGHIIDAGMSFSNAYVVLPLCQPSRATFVTGQYAHNHGIYSNDVAMYDAFRQNDILATALRRAGYLTGFFGKYLNAFRGGSSIPVDWTQFRGMDGTVGQKYYEYNLIDENGGSTHYGSTASDYNTNKISELAAAFITANPGRPKFVWHCPHCPHADLQETGTGPIAAPPYDGLLAGLAAPRNADFNEADVSDKPGYVSALPVMSATTIANIDHRYQKEAESLLSMNDAVDTVVAALTSIGELERTYLIFTSDHGYMKGGHRLPDGKIVPYTRSIQVGLHISGPGIAAGSTRTELVGNVDLAPTILQLTGASAFRVLDGKSFFPLLFADEVLGADFRSHLLIESPVVIVNDYFTGVSSPVLGPAYVIPSYSGLRSTDWHYIEYTGDSPVSKELYSVTADPDQLTNLNNNTAYSAAQAELASILASVRTCVGSACVIGG